MAKAVTKTGIVLAAVLALVLTGGVGTALGQGAAPTGSAGQTPAQTPQAKAAMTAGLESYRQGDFERAASFFQQAQDSKEQLSAEERQRLGTYVTSNKHCLAAQREGAEQIAQADLALRQGKYREVEGALKKLSNNIYLSKSDKLKSQEMAEWLSRRSAASTSAKPQAAAAKPQAAREENSGKPKGDSKTLLTAARAAFMRGELDQAESLATEAQRTASGWNFRLWGDTPEKVLHDVQISRAELAAFGTIQDPKTDAAKQLTAQARKALQNGDSAKARDLALQAKALKVQYNWWDNDTPDKLLAEIEKGPAVSAAPVAKAGDKEDPRLLLKKGRELYQAGKMDDAEKMARNAAADKSHRWLLFEDSPDKLRQDIADARGRRDQHEADKLRADTRLKNSPAPPAPEPRPTAVAQVPVQASAPPTPAPAAAAASGQWVIPTLPPTKAPNGQWVVPTLPPVPAVPVVAVSNTSKQQAQQLMAEARKLEQDGKLLDARQRVLAAQKYGASFGSDEEDNPDRALQRLGSQAQKQMTVLVRQAEDQTCLGFQDPSRYQTADGQLAQAKQLAVGFGLDVQPVEGLVLRLREEREKTTASLASGQLPNRATEPMPPLAVKKEPDGKKLLDDARRELRAGDTARARRMAEDVFKGNYGVQAEAEALLRSIDAEEFEQRRLVSDKTFDAGLSAFRRQDFSQAETIFRTLDPTLLTVEKKSKLKNLLMSPDLQPRELAKADSNVSKVDTLHAPGKANASDKGGKSPVTAAETLAQQVQAMMDVQFQKLRGEGLEAQREAAKTFQAGDSDRAMDILENYLSGLSETSLEPARVAMLKRPVESRMQQLKMLKAQRELTERQNGPRDEFGKKMGAAALAKENKEKAIADLMKQYNSFYKEGKYDEAIVMAEKAHELDPDNVAANQGVAIANTQRRLTRTTRDKNDREDFFYKEMQGTEEQGAPADMTTPMVFDKKAAERARNRENNPSLKPYEIKTKNQKELEIERRMNTPITVNFKDTPLEQVIVELRAMTGGLNIVPDFSALGDEGIDIRKPITMEIENVSLKSALKLLLDQAHLVYVVEDEVLKITTKAGGNKNLVTRTYQVVDLVIPIDNNTMPGTANLQAILEQNMKSQNVLNGSGGSTMRTSGGRTMGNGQQVGGAQTYNASMTSEQTPQQRAPGQSMEDLLIKLITNTIAPTTWSSMGGPATIDYFPLGMALVINQTPDIQEQIQELLTALRRLQDLEVAVEVRFITLSESFFERIGMDFNVNITNRNAKYEPQLVTQQFAPPGQLNTFRPTGFVSGLTPAGNLTSDLGIPIGATSFGPAIPMFGGFPNIPGSNGGLALGLAFLSDIQVFMFMEAAQGDQRSNVMQAPKLTLFNGQTSTINIFDQQFFVINVQVIQAGGQLVFNPLNTPFPSGVFLTIQAVVSADRRFVRLTMTPSLTNIAGPTTALFPVTTFITPVFDGGAQGQPIPFTQFVQQPSFTTVSVQTTVSVPDGGTVLLGGLKTLREGRTEFGPPILSKLPYINRLFKNVGYGREAESLMLMVTPRIIINEEEEGVQTGVTNQPPR